MIDVKTDFDKAVEAQAKDFYEAANGQDPKVYISAMAIALGALCFTTGYSPDTATAHTHRVFRENKRRRFETQKALEASARSNQKIAPIQKEVAEEEVEFVEPEKADNG